MAKHAGGAPTKYSEELQAKADAYLNEYSEKYEHLMPSIEGLAEVLDVSRETLYAWSKDGKHKELSDTLGRLKAKQRRDLVENGLSSKFNPTITKLMLSHNHGVNEKTETDITSKGKRLNTWVVNPVTTDKE